MPCLSSSPWKVSSPGLRNHSALVSHKALLFTEGHLSCRHNNSTFTSRLLSDAVMPDGETTDSRSVGHRSPLPGLIPTVTVRLNA